MTKKNGNRPIIAVFGSSRTREDSPDWRWAESLGEGLGRAGFDVMTGGYEGVMAAASRGAARAGAQSVGVTMSIFRSPPNGHLTKEIPTHDFFERLKVFMETADGVAVCAGGLGTLVELSLAWNLLELSMQRFPIVLQRDAWEEILAMLDRKLIFCMGDGAEILDVASTPEDAVRRLSEVLSPPQGDPGR